MSKTSNTGGITIPKFKLFHRLIATKTEWCWQKKNQKKKTQKKKTDEDQRKKNPDMNPHSYAYLTFHKCTKNIQ
jgi:hypothetical protein